ncbi:LysE family translocator [Pantoea stewartii subsp. indologenes]|uniref:LysE family translocator n=1 Tax=Pantoea stewartii TaxID=66269 RepID=UPI001980EE5F|nr:LysE family translocator [Pantoea stewartii]MDK2632648.1 LysE family translocator [Pantoea stewartii subsp. indologenes]
MWDASSFLAALLVYTIGTASPGPGNLSIANAAMNDGRQAGLVLATGVISGSLCWGLLTAFGVSAILVSHHGFIVWLKLLGAAYLLWLASKALRSAFRPGDLAAHPARSHTRLRGYYLQGLGLHLTNPKAALTWFTVTSVDLTRSAPQWQSYVLVATCALTGVMIFGLYALIFASQTAETYLKRARRSFDVICAGFYALVAMGFLVSLR